MKLTELREGLDKKLSNVGLPPLTDEEFVEVIGWLEGMGKIEVDGDEVHNRYGHIVEVAKGE